MQEPAKASPTREGRCELCGETLSKRAMSRHLQSCREKNPPETCGRDKPLKGKVFHLVAEGRDLPDYWMHIEALAEATVQWLDAFLRATWLECCGHMSAFTIEKTRYSVAPLREWEEKGMNIALEKVLRPGMRFYHDYDFGTTTHLALRVVSEKEQLIGKKSMWILARNLPPQIPCDLCDKLATRVCCSCWGNEKWVCDDCAPKHECGAEMLLPVVNSPRSGMCGYDGQTGLRLEEEWEEESPAPEPTGHPDDPTDKTAAQGDLEMRNPPNAIAIPRGTCYLCGQSLSRDHMSDHLESCREKHPPKPSGKREYHRENVFHLAVEGTDSPQYWMHLEAPATMTLADLDALLRRVWLECCGHLSQFIIEGNEYVADDLWQDEELDGPVPIEGGGEIMDIPLGELLQPGMTFDYEYDMGSTTELTLRVVSQRPLDIRSRFIRIIARNHPPDIQCDSCGKPAAQICTECFFDGKGWLCDGCAPKHKCGEELLLPLLNSPRAGTCAYGRDFDEDAYFEEEAEE